jgi:predicted nucleic-acid-binding protein
MLLRNVLIGSVNVIGIDTNVLVRIIVQDDIVQTDQAIDLIKKEETVFISAVVLCEAAWVFETCYMLTKQQLIDVFERILRIRQFGIEYSDTIWLAIEEYKRINTDLSDCIIGAIAQHHECTAIATFDKKAAKSAYFVLISE